ncbi:MAG: hypothetical protein R2704_06545 [Microthrixaceae bacterium]
MIVGYLLTRTNAVSWPLYAVGPMAVLVLTSARSTLNPRQTLRIGAGLAAGTLAALAPWSSATPHGVRWVPGLATPSARRAG